MINQLSFENIRGKSRDLTLFNRTTLLGVNGIGKSSIADAIAYTFAGRTAWGKSAPVEIISDDTDKMTIKVVTPKATIERSLTRKKTQSIKFTPHGKPTISLTQEQLSGLSCSPDAFLSAFTCGYFMSLPNETRMAVLREFTPKIDKFGVLESILGEKVEEHYKTIIPIDKRSDIAITAVAKNRRDIEKELARVQGSLSVLRILVHPGDKPAEPESIDHLTSAKSAWNKHHEAVRHHEATKLQIQNAEFHNKGVREKILELQEQLNGLQLAKPVDSAAHEESVTKLLVRLTELKQGEVKLPTPPAFASLPDSVHCPTCGQIVGVKHKEAVESKNADLFNAYQVQLNQANLHNEEIQFKIKDIERLKLNLILAHSDQEKSYREGNRIVSDLTDRIVKLERTMHVTPTLGDLPTPPPFEELSDTEIRSAIETYSVGKSKIKSWETAVAQFDLGFKQIEKLLAEAGNYEVQIASLKKIEEALAVLDEKVFAINAEHYKLKDGYSFHITDGDITLVDAKGKTYAFMSEGERLRANARVCEKICNSLPRKVKMIFIDNYDLSSEDIQLDVEQIIYAKVTPAAELSVVDSGLPF